MTWMMVAAINIQSSDGISKKIISQASSMVSENETSLLGCLIDEVPALISVSSSSELSVIERYDVNYDNDTRTLKYIKQCRDLSRLVSESDILKKCNGFYIRHMMPNRQLIRMLSLIKKQKKKIIYEIPTYPYYFEQMSEAHNKIKTSLRLILETIYWPIIYSKIDRLTVIRCRTKSLRLKKMYDIKNGISNNIHVTNNKHILSADSFNIIGVGTIYKYHGYDKIIAAIQKSHGMVNGKIVRFFIVGESDEIDKLKKKVLGSEIQKNIIFCGKKFGVELQELYRIADLAVGTLALNLRRANIDTAIKNVEYLSQKIPIITSGKIFDVREESKLYRIISSNSSVNLSNLLEFSKEYYQVDRTEEIEEILKKFSWSYIMTSAIDGV